MKSLLISILFSMCSWAQSSNFILKSDKIIWENVIISEQQEVVKLIQRHPRLEILSVAGSVYKGRGTEIKHNCEDSSSIMRSNAINFDFEIELSEGKYRVTVFNIYYTPLEKGGKKYPIEKVTSFSAAQPGADLLCLDSYFNKIFSMTLVYQNKL